MRIFRTSELSSTTYLQHGQPLTTYNDLLSRQKPQWAELPPEAKQAFEIIKQKLAMASCLNHFHADVPALLGTDASQYGVGVVLLQIYPDEGRDRLNMHQDNLTTAERNYSLLEKEALRIIFSVQKFHLYL